MLKIGKFIHQIILQTPRERVCLLLKALWLIYYKQNVHMSVLRNRVKVTGYKSCFLNFLWLCYTLQV